MKEIMRKVGSLLCAIAIVGVFGIADPMPLQAEEAVDVETGESTEEVLNGFVLSQDVEPRFDGTVNIPTLTENATYHKEVTAYCGTNYVWMLGKCTDGEIKPIEGGAAVHGMPLFYASTTQPPFKGKMWERSTGMGLVIVPSMYDMRFDMPGDYNVYLDNAEDYVTVKVLPVVAAFTKRQPTGMEIDWGYDYMDGYCVSGSDSKQEEIYFICQKNASIEKGNDGMPVIYDNEKETEKTTVFDPGLIQISQLADVSGYEVYKLTLDTTTQYNKRAGIFVTYQDENNIEKTSRFYFDMYSMEYQEPHVHKLTFVPAKEAAVGKDGNSAYYYCDDCETYFEDEDASEEIEYGSWVIPALPQPSPTPTPTPSPTPTPAPAQVSNPVQTPDQNVTQPAPTQPAISGKLKLSRTKVKLKKGKSVTVKVKDLKKGDKIKSWKSSNKKIATVNKNGKITAKKKGTCKVTVITKQGRKGVVKVTVKAK